MKFLEAKKLADSFSGGELLAFLFGLSGTGELFDVYLRAAGARRNRDVRATTLPFNTLAQTLRSAPRPGALEVFLVLPWDLVPEADWRSGIPGDGDEAAIRRGAEEVVGLLRQRPGARLIYLPAPMAPLFSDPARDRSLARWLESLVLAAGAATLPAEAFALGGYLASGCPVTGGWMGETARLVVDLLTRGTGQPKKVLVTDLDNVLWHGIIGDDGFEGVHYEAHGRGYRHFIFQTFLKRLKRDGTLVAAVSRNQQDVAVVPFRSGKMVLGEDDLVAVLASYRAKSAQIRELGQRLNLGLDSFVFVDDNPIELAEVSMSLPGVTCVEFPARDDELPRLLGELGNLFARPQVTAEDRDRTTMYRRRAEGLAAVGTEGADLTSFLQGLEMKLTLHDRSCGDRTRAVQLINKTNQFNLNGLRVTDEAVGAILAAGGRLLGASLADRTGEHGEILTCLITADGTITSLVMSCRVFQRRVEHAFLAWLSSQGNPPRALQWTATPRNEPFSDFLRDLTGNVPADGTVPLDAKSLRERFAAALGLFAVAGP